jgi:hypothetical protein
MHDPVSGRMATVGKFTDLFLFERIEGWASGQVHGHGRPSSPSLPHILNHF